MTTVSLNIRDVPAAQAMNLIADLAGAVIEEHAVAGGKPTWVVRARAPGVR